MISESLFPQVKNIRLFAIADVKQKADITTSIMKLSAEISPITFNSGKNHLITR